MRLSKRRAKGGGGLQSATNAVLAVHHRELNDQEVAAQEMRRMQLEPLEADDEEEEDNAEVRIRLSVLLCRDGKSHKSFPLGGR